MRALAVYPEDEIGRHSADRYTQYNNITLSEIWDLTPRNTSCIYIDMTLSKDLKGKYPYSHKQLGIVEDITMLSRDNISMKIDTSKVMNERPFLQA